MIHHVDTACTVWTHLAPWNGPTTCDHCGAERTDNLTTTVEPGPVEPGQRCDECGGSGRVPERDPETGAGCWGECDCVLRARDAAEPEERTLCEACWPAESARDDGEARRMTA